MKKMTLLLSVLAAFILLFSAVPAPAALAQDTYDASYLLKTEGNRLVNGNGETVRLVGINIPYLSWSSDAEAKINELLPIALDDWQGNCIRLAVVPKYWLMQDSTGAKYRAQVDDIIAKVAAKGKYILLDNHSFYLPGEDSVKFWADAAARYKDHPFVLYELFNEPAACSWQQYYEGGKLTYTGKSDWGEDVSVTVDSKGIPNLLKTVRATGAKNVCILPGINWSFDLTYITEDNLKELAKSIAEESNVSDEDAFVNDYVAKYQLKETTGNGIMFATHPYPSKPAEWDQYILDTIKQFPVVASECGPTEKESGFVRKLSDNDQSYLDTLTSYVDKYELSITPWAWGAWPYLNQEPSNKLSAFGDYMYKYFLKSAETKAITLFDETDYEGNKYSLEAGKYTAGTLSAKGFDLSKLSSVTAKDDRYQYTIKLYSGDNFTGDSYTLVPNAKNIAASTVGFIPKSVEILREEAVSILTSHAKVKVSGFVNNQKGDYLIDGKTKTFWQNESKKVSTAVITLDGYYALNKISLAHAAEASMMSVLNASDYTISVSTDGEVYTRIVDVTGNNMGLTEYKFEQVVAKYIKIDVRKGSMLDDGSVYLAEVMAYGVPYVGSVTKTVNTVIKTKYVGHSFPLWTIITSAVAGSLFLLSIALILFLLFRKKKKAVK